MFLILEVFLSLVRIIILLLGALLTIILGDKIFDAVNYFLVSLNFPCLGLISFLVIFVTPFAAIYGAHIRRFFWQREAHYTAVILAISSLVGIVVSVLPIDIAFTLSQSSNINCNPQPTLNAQLVHTLGTAIVAMFLAAIGMDFGVALKHVSHHIHHRQSHKSTEKKKKGK